MALAVAREGITEVVIGVIRQSLKSPEDCGEEIEVAPQLNLWLDLELCSDEEVGDAAALAAELTAALQDHGITVSPEEVEAADTVASLIAIICRKLGLPDVAAA